MDLCLEEPLRTFVHAMHRLTPPHRPDLDPDVLKSLGPFPEAIDLGSLFQDSQPTKTLLTRLPLLIVNPQHYDLKPSPKVYWG